MGRKHKPCGHFTRLRAAGLAQQAQVFGSALAAALCAQALAGRWRAPAPGRSDLQGVRADGARRCQPQLPAVARGGLVLQRAALLAAARAHRQRLVVVAPVQRVAVAGFGQQVGCVQAF